MEPFTFAPGFICRCTSSERSRSAVRKLRPMETISLKIQATALNHFFPRKAVHSRGGVWPLADRRRLVESVTLGVRAVGSDGARPEMAVCFAAA